MTRYPPLVDRASSTRPSRPASTAASALAAWLAERTQVTTRGDLSVAVGGVSLSTARLQAGDLYAALPGFHQHGARFCVAAAEAGAAAVLTDPAVTARFVTAGRAGDSAATRRASRVLLERVSAAAAGTGGVIRMRPILLIQAITLAAMLVVSGWAKAQTQAQTQAQPQGRPAAPLARHLDQALALGQKLDELFVDYVDFLAEVRDTCLFNC